MQPKSDAQLLREYAERGAETAFAELVARHTNLVYSAALRGAPKALFIPAQPSGLGTRTACVKALKARSIGF